MPLDPSVLDELRQLERDSDPGLLRELSEIFLTQTPRLLRDIREATERGDARALEEAAHLLKSTAANLGARTLSTLASELERLARSSRVAEAAPLLVRLESELALASIEIANLA
jgi:HPt (histidine-containing phosphotransfer) domain-containing protein